MRVPQMDGYNQLEEVEDTDDNDETSMAVRTVHWKGVAEEPGHYR